MIKFLAIILIALALTGCSTSLKNLYNVSSEISSGTTSEVITSAKLSPVELMQVTHSENTFLQIKNKWKGIAEQGELVPAFLNDQEFQDDYSTLVRNYKAVHAIAKAHFDEYSIDNQTYLKELDQDMNELDTAFKNAKTIRAYKDLAVVLVKSATVAASMIVR